MRYEIGDDLSETNVCQITMFYTLYIRNMQLNVGVSPMAIVVNS